MTKATRLSIDIMPKHMLNLGSYLYWSLCAGPPCCVGSQWGYVARVGVFK